MSVSPISSHNCYARFYTPESGIHERRQRVGDDRIDATAQNDRFQKADITGILLIPATYGPSLS